MGPSESRHYLIGMAYRLCTDYPIDRFKNCLSPALLRRLCDVPAASAILDRLLHHAEIIAIAGRSYRLREGVAEQNQRQASQPKKDKSAASLLG